MKIFISLVFLFALPLFATEITPRRVPDGGIQPQAAVDVKGAVHLIYYKGDPGNGDIFYAKSTDGGATFSAPLRVNSVPKSAIATGNIRGAHLALGRNNRVHVAWNGSSAATPRGPGKESPMLYARLNDAGTAFEEQRNLITKYYGLDGGGSVAADLAGHVYVFWHAMGAERGEENRRVYVTRSDDDGKTFSPEIPAFKENLGACGCCGMNSFADSRGNVFAICRAATDKTERGMVLLASKGGASFNTLKLDALNTTQCPMSSESFYEAGEGVLSAWENNGQVFFNKINSYLMPSAAIPAPGAGRGRKHPAIAENAAGETLLVWTEGMGWDRGGSLSWQLYDKSNKPTLQKGSTVGVPKWSILTAFARADGGFTILY
ncbi:MAG TPA: sialidase family protein [Planctomycetota bacterium]|nr:sialidase family protein [Planctomycetota bacterium]